MPILAAQTTFAERHGIGYPGLVADMVLSNIVTRTCETAAGIGFGLAVGQGVRDKGAILGGTNVGFVGISCRDMTQVPIFPNVTVDKYAQYANMNVMNFGQIWCQPGANVAANDPVFFNPTTGALSNAIGAASVAAPTFAGTGNGVLTLSGTPSGGGAIAGTYRVALIQAIANSGVFMIFDPNGAEKGTAVVGAAVTGPLQFTIADGATDFVVGDTFSLVVTMAGIGPVLGARWVDTALSGGLARVSLGVKL